MAKNAPIGLVGLVLFAVSLLLFWFVILSGVTNSTPLNKTYFLRADTSGITGARSVTQWTYFYLCGRDNQDCGSARAAPPFGYAWNANPNNAPASLIGSHGGDTTSFKFFYMWRFGWIFLIITLFFEVIAFFSGFLACCSRLGAAIASLISMFALMCYSIAVALITATFFKARNAFTAENREATLGRWAFGFLWGSYAALLFSVVPFVGIFTSKNHSEGGGGGMWRSRSQRINRRSSYDGRRVKEDYS